ncbi:unnamed protein product [Caenorhabditis sp. 36 PRJEB53466]|nr:unnamed protein product [Caenorhabditis sp. 36 PRJEB53466]
MIVMELRVHRSPIRVRNKPFEEKRRAEEAKLWQTEDERYRAVRTLKFLIIFLVVCDIFHGADDYAEVNNITTPIPAPASRQKVCPIRK